MTVENPHAASLCAICGKAFRWIENNGPLAGRIPWIKDLSDETHAACDAEIEKREERERCAEQERSRIAAFYRATGMPPDLFESRTFEKFEVTPANRRAFDVINAWQPEDKWGVLLQGNPGTGKSHLMLALANRWIPRGYTFFFKSVSNMFDDLRGSYETGRYQHEIERIKKHPCVVLDDIGAEKPNEWVEEKLFQILDHRLNHVLPTFFTTNCPTSLLKTQLHERITSRLKEMAVIVTVGGEDRRNRKYEQRLLEVEKRIAKRQHELGS